MEAAAPLTQREDLTVIVNPKSGSVKSDTDLDIQSALEDRGVRHKVLEIAEGVDAESLTRQAIEHGAQHIVVSGGDGTVMAVMNGILKSGEDVLLSVSPGGTANLIAGALGVSAGIEEAIKTALFGPEKRVDVAKCGDRFLALGVGIGLAEKLVSGTDEEIKHKVGRLAYAVAALKELGARPRRFRLVPADGEPVEVPAVGIVVANVGGIGQRIKFAPDAKVDDGLLDVCVLHRLGLRDAVRLAWKAILGGLEDDRAVSYYQWPSVRIESQGRWPIQIDGEEVDLTTPLTVEVVPRSVRMTIPVEPVT